VSITLCCVSGGEPARLAALLELCRDAVDELVVALDDRVAQAPPAADRVFRIPYEAPFERTTAWLYAQCRGDWILRLDDDEVPSASLLAALPELVAADVTHVWLPRRWLFGGPDRYLDAHPWIPDFQLRLSVNDPRLVRFPGITHVPLEVAGAARYAEQPLYHLDLLRPREERERKAAAYERARPGLRLAGRALNHALYLPEEVDAPTAPMPPADLELVRRVLAGAGAATGPRTAAAATRETIDARWALGPVDAAVELELVHAPPRLEEGERAQALLRLRNGGTTTLAPPGVHLGTWWDGETAGPWTQLPAPVEPGGETLAVATLAAPARGPHTVELQLVHAHGRFGPLVRLEVEVVPRRRVGIYVREATAGLFDAVAREVTRAAPELEAVAVGEELERSIADGLEPGRRRLRSFVTASRRARRRPPFAVDALVVPSLEATTLLERRADLAAVELARGAPVLVAPPPPSRSALDRLLLRRIVRSPNVTVGDLDELEAFLGPLVM
jgi:hypothetical protein